MQSVHYVYVPPLTELLLLNAQTTSPPWSLRFRINNLLVRYQVLILPPIVLNLKLMTIKDVKAITRVAAAGSAKGLTCQMVLFLPGITTNGPRCPRRTDKLSLTPAPRIEDAATATTKTRTENGRKYPPTTFRASELNWMTCPDHFRPSRRRVMMMAMIRLLTTMPATALAAGRANV